MRKAGLIVWLAHQRVAQMIGPGVTTAEIDSVVVDVFQKANAEPLFLNYPGVTPFPAVTCISVNEEIVHGIPGNRRLQEGDIVSVDTGCRINSWCGDAAYTHPIGKIAGDRKKLLRTTSEALSLAIERCGLEKNWSSVAKAMQEKIRAKGCSIVEELVGHGIGKQLHESPSVPNYFDPNVEDFTLRPGVVIAIEPMVNLGARHTKTLKDHWTIIAKDKKPSAHFEHTVAITGEGVVRLTGPPNDEELAELPLDPGPPENWISW